MINKKDIVQAVIILFIAVCTAFIYNHISESGIALLGQWDESKGVVNANSKSKAIDSSIEINDPKAVKQIVKEKQRVIIDVRHAGFYKLGHLPGAISFPLADLNSDSDLRRLRELADLNKGILVYCSGFQCTDSHTFAEKLKKLNYTDVKVYPGGFEQWEEMKQKKGQEKGYEIEK